MKLEINSVEEQIKATEKLFNDLENKKRELNETLKLIENQQNELRGQFAVLNVVLKELVDMNTPKPDEDKAINKLDQVTE